MARGRIMRRSVDADKLMDGLGRLATDTDLCKRYGNCTPWIPYSAVRKLISDMILEAKESCDDAVNRQEAINKIKKRLFETAFNNVGIKQNVDETLSDVAENRLKNWFNELPSAQPDIIYCKDCKWYGRADKRRFYRGMDCLQKRIATIVPDRDFCSKAERRTKNADVNT